MNMTEWQTIETAPKDGTRVLVAYLYGNEYRVALSYWTDDSFFDYAGWYIGVSTISDRVHYWMSLPTAPELHTTFGDSSD